MKITTISYSLSRQPKTLGEWESGLVSQIDALVKGGSQVIVYPELNFMGLTDYLVGYQEISSYVQDKLLGSVARVLSKDVLLCLGSGPRVHEGKIYNTAFIWANGSWSLQDKIHLTPWEVDFTPGMDLRIFDYRGLRTCVVICFDVEQPGIALYLKKKGVDLVLVPSATANRNGSQRVNRCASARSIELGAAVVTAPLVGDSKCDLIDHSEGRAALFLPAQEAVVVAQENYSEYSVAEEVVAHFQLDQALLTELKKRDGETKPYLQTDLI